MKTFTPTNLASPMIDRISLGDRRVWSSGIRHLKKQDPKLGRIIQKVGSFDFNNIRGTEDYYEFLVASIVYQQIAGAAARAILGRFKGLYKDRYPTPQEYLATSTRKLRSAGLSPQKISYIRDLCRRIVAGRLDLARLDGLSDDEIVRELDEVRGVGRWTAEMFLIFALRRANVLPFDDLGIRKGIQKAYRLRSFPSKERMEELRAMWQPYSSIATLYLWRSLSQETPKTKPGKS